MNAHGASAEGVEWLRSDGAQRDVVLSSRVRLARNISGFPFLQKATREDRCEILNLIRHTTTQANLAPQLVTLSKADSSSAATARPSGRRRAHEHRRR